LDRVDQRPFPPGDYDVVVVGSGPGGLQVGHDLARLGVRHAHISRDDAPGGMFRRWPIYERLLSWTKPDAPFERGSREYEWYDHNSLLAEEPSARALVAEQMDRSHDVPSRTEMERALAVFAERARVPIRYGCAWEGTRAHEDGFALATSDGEYRARALVFALGVTDPWRPPMIVGCEDIPHYADVPRSPEELRGRDVIVIGKRNSAFELATGLLPWARRIVLVSPSPIKTDVIARATVRARYLPAYEDHAVGGGVYVVDGAVRRILRLEPGYRVHVDGTTLDGRFQLEGDVAIAATGFATPLLDLPQLGVATVAQNRIPALTPFWESVTVPGVYFAGGATQGAPGLRKHGVVGTSAAVQGFRYNARILARRLAETLRQTVTRSQVLAPDEVVPVLLHELAHGPELWTQKGYLARVLTADPSGGMRDEGVLPLADFVDAAGPDGVAAAVELDRDGLIRPQLYLRRSGAVEEGATLPLHPLHAFDQEDYRRLVAEQVATVLP
jgi:thioredoxin reductase